MADVEEQRPGFEPDLVVQGTTGDTHDASRGEEPGVLPEELAPDSANERASQVSPITVLIVDDHPMVRSGERLLLDDPRIRVVGDASSGAEAVERAKALRPDVVLMDIKMPGMDGIAATAEIKRESPESAVIIVTGDASEAFVSRAIEAGAVGYLLKGASSEMLVYAVRLARIGGSLIDMRMLPALGTSATHETGEVERALAGLSPRELEVLRYLAAGLTNKEIAREMHYSVGTVKNIVQRTIEKLGVTDRTQAAVVAVRAGL